jgi:hypothetical protein
VADLNSYLPYVVGGVGSALATGILAWARDHYKLNRQEQVLNEKKNVGK